MEDNQLNEAYLVVFPIVDAENLLVDFEIQVMDDVLVDPDVKENFVAALGVTLKAKAKQSKKYGHCGEKANKHTKTTRESNPKYIVKLARVAAAKQAARIAAAEQAARIDAAEQATNTS
nr:hypothetical protein [Tanacetum cinerariifolium]